MRLVWEFPARSSHGRWLRDGIAAAASRHGLESHFFTEGPPISLNYITRDADGNPSLAFRTLFAQEMLRHGVMMPWIAVSAAHSDDELAATLDALDRALPLYRKALDEGVELHLVGPAIRPVFRSRN